MHGISAVLAFAAMTLLAGHTWHALAPTCVLKVPFTQAAHAVAGPEKPTSHAHWSLPALDTLFAGQDRHALMLVAAKLDEKLLLGHFVHSTLPETVLYVPAGHSAHWPGEVSVVTSYPALQMQSKMDTEATADALVLTHAVHTVMPVQFAYVFAGQSVHAEDPWNDLYLPSAQAAHSGPNAPV